MRGEAQKTATISGKLTLAIVLALLAVPAAASAEQAREPVQSASDGVTFQVRYTATFSEDALIFGKLMGYDTVCLQDGNFLDQVAYPMLPVQPVRIALPPGMAVTDVRVAGTEAVELAGEYDVFPAQPPRSLAEVDTVDAFVPGNRQVYASIEAYPASQVEFTGQTSLAGQGIVGLDVYPLHYIPAEKKLTLYTSIEIVIHGVAGYQCTAYLPEGISDRGRDAYRRMVAGMVVNPEDVQLQVSSDPLPISRGVAPGSYDYVIITQSGWVDDFQPLADWKTKKGTPAAIVTTDWIYNDGGYSGTNQEKIADFVYDANNVWGATYFLLGGDTAVVPYHTRNIDGEDVPNDTFYADFGQNWTCDVHVGRASVTTTAAIATFNSKVFVYEKTPPSGGYAKSAFFCGFDLDDSTESEEVKKYIESNHLPGDWTYSSEYDSEIGTHKTDVINYLNAGSNLVNHSDHGGNTFMGTGYVNHGGAGLNNFNMAALTNGDRQSILYSLACHPCAYDTATCIAEAFVRNSNGGGIAFVGNSRNGVYYVGYDDDHLSMRYDRYFFRSLFDQGHYVLGECFSDHKNDTVTTATIYRYLFTGLTLLGDPELPIWTEEPAGLTVTHDPSLYVGQYATFLVDVDSGGSPVNGATVCLWKNGDLYEVSTTSLGVASFGITPATTGPMYVTVTLHNYLPYEGQGTVVGSGDLSGDDDIDLEDFAAFQECLQMGSLPPECQNGDLDGSEAVDLNDYPLFYNDIAGPTK